MGYYQAEEQGFDENDASHYLECECENSLSPSGTESVTLADDLSLSPDDRQSLETIISLWPTLTLETKIDILKTIESARVAVRNMSLAADSVDS